MKYLIFTLLFVATQCLTADKASAQNVDSTTVFGYVVPKSKTDSEGNPKRLFKPAAFKRFGVTTGALFPLNSSPIGGTSGFRFEYGFSNKWSILADFQGNRSQDTSFSAFQGGLLVRSMPFKSRRLQPYFGAGWSVGGGRSGNFNRGRGRNFDPIENDFNNQIRQYGVVQAGVNYIVFNRLIASVEGNYQTEIGGTNTQKLSAASAKIGLAYQFGKRK